MTPNEEEQENLEDKEFKKVKPSEKGKNKQHWEWLMARQALFADLVYDENGKLLETAVVGGEAYYVIDDAGFRRHVEAEIVDRHVLSIFLEQVEQNKELATEQMLNMLGRDDLFTKAIALSNETG